jgi:hypothetical protein
MILIKSWSENPVSRKTASGGNMIATIISKIFIGFYKIKLIIFMLLLKIEISKCFVLSLFALIG